MQSKLLMTNSFPIVLETQIAEDMEIFGSLSDDTARAIDCANADTFCKPTNLADIKSQTTAIAVQTFQEIATYDNAVQAANTLNVVIRRGAKFTLKSLWSVFLVSIALVMLLVEASQNRQKVMLIIREGVENRVKRLVLRYRHLELVGRLALKFTIVQPVLYRRDRVRLIIRTAISN